MSQVVKFNIIFLYIELSQKNIVAFIRETREKGKVVCIKPLVSHPKKT
jgi:two-component SAPR family response regulator